MIDCKIVAEDSNMIINGYAFTKEDKNRYNKSKER